MWFCYIKKWKFEKAHKGRSWKQSDLQRFVEIHANNPDKFLLSYDEQKQQKNLFEYLRIDFNKDSNQDFVVGPVV